MACVCPVCLVQVSGKNDHHYFGRPEHATNERPIYLADSSSPGADLAGEVRGMTHSICSFCKVSSHFGAPLSAQHRHWSVSSSRQRHHQFWVDNAVRSCCYVKVDLQLVAGTGF